HALVVYAHYDMVVVAHNRVCGNIDCEYAGELADAFFDPAAAVLEVLAGGVVFSAEKGAAYAAAHDVVPGGIRE
ncbi:hypothetical protein, partial [Vibrio sp.]|uniref:hypothetical protein n=1 Tax=Vibrio sp. TaxID=678 RepID=UPI003D0D2610